MKRKKVFLALCLLFLLLVTVECLAEEPEFVLAKTCYNTHGALSYPFRCEMYTFQGQVFWVGKLLDGTVFRIERGTEVLYELPFVYEEDV